MPIEQPIEGRLELADLASQLPITVDVIGEPAEPVAARRTVGSRFNSFRRRSRASTLPVTPIWSRIPVGSLASWSAMKCSISVRIATKARRCSSTASISASSGSVASSVWTGPSVGSASSARAVATASIRSVLA